MGRIQSHCICVSTFLLLKKHSRIIIASKWVYHYNHMVFIFHNLCSILQDQRLKDFIPSKSKNKPDFKPIKCDLRPTSWWNSYIWPKRTTSKWWFITLLSHWRNKNSLHQLNIQANVHLLPSERGIIPHQSRHLRVW